MKKTNKNRRVMKTVYALLIWVCFMVLCSECDNLTVFVISKAIALLVAIIVGKLFSKTLTEEELNEEV